MVPTRFASAFSERSSVRRVWSSCLVVTLAFGSSLACAHKQSRDAPATVLEIATPTTDADVWVDGAYIGQVAAVSGKLRLSPGIHRVEVRKPGHFPVQRTVRVDKGAGGSVVVTAEMLADPR